MFLVSFGILINNTSAGGEPVLGTCMLILGFLFLSLGTCVFFRSNWPFQHKPYLIAMLVLVSLLLLVIIALGIRIWIPFKSVKGGSTR